MQYGIVDLGSNSFRIEIFRVSNGTIHSLSYHKETIRLAAGLDSDCNLTERVQLRALNSLHRFSLLLKSIPPENIRAVGTQTFRLARNAPFFLQRAEQVLGTTIQVLSGNHEAQLAYLGATFNNLPQHTNALVIDIGGGSTEFALGTKEKIIATTSLPIGCVNTTLRFAADGFFDAQRYKNAQEQLALRFQKSDFEFPIKEPVVALGAAGTFHALKDACIALQWTDGRVSHREIQRMLRYILKLQNLHNIQFDFIRPDRRDVLIGGLLVLDAVFRFTQLSCITPVRAGVRTGLLLDLLHQHNVKFHTSNTIL